MLTKLVSKVVINTYNVVTSFLGHNLVGLNALSRIGYGEAAHPFLTTN